MITMAESWFHDGASSEFHVRIILAPDMILLLFLDGSSVVESTKSFTIYESCWMNTQ